MTVAMRTSWWMGDSQAAAFASLLRSLDLPTADEQAQRAMILAQLHSHRRQPQQALEACSEGLKLEVQLDPTCSSTVGWGVAPMLHCLAAQQVPSRAFNPAPQPQP